MDDVQHIATELFYSDIEGIPRQKLKDQKNREKILEMVSKVKHCFLDL